MLTLKGRLERRGERVYQWAMNRDHAILAEALAIMVPVALEFRRQAQLPRRSEVFAQARAQAGLEMWQHFASIVQRKLDDSKKGGVNAGAAKKADAAATHRKWLTAERNLLKSGKTHREVAGILAKRFRVTPTAMRVGLKKAKVS